MIDLDIDAIEKLYKKYGSSLYVFNQDEFIDNYLDLETTFKNIYSNYHICYSYKTNYTPAICKLVKELGGYAEVVSDMEYELALKVGYDSSKIVFNGPNKGRYLEYHLKNNGINNIDRIEEAYYICSLKRDNPDVNIKSGIRVNFDIDAGYVSRFGIYIDQLGDILNLLKANNIIVNGIHCHMSRARGLNAWNNRARNILNIIDEYDLKDIEYISLGSGMFGKMDESLKKQFSGDIPTYNDYANVVIKQFSDFFRDNNRKPLLFTEPGTTLISKYVDFIGRVIGIKKVNNKTFVLLDCSFHNLGEVCQMKNIPIKIFSCGNKREFVKGADFVGYTCLEQDVMFRDFNGDISVGDFVMFGNVGGYSIVEKPPFIMPNCPVISISKGEDQIIKRQETMNDIFSTFLFE